MQQELPVEEEAYIKDVLFKQRRSWLEVKHKIPPHALGICGYRNVGKTTFSNELSGNRLGEHEWDIYVLPCNTVFEEELIFRSWIGKPTVALADPVREVAFNLLKLPSTYEYDKHKDDPMPEHNNRSVRDYLIRIGQIGRKIDPGYWVKRVVMPYYVEYGEHRKEIIISDLRFRSELKAMDDGEIWPLTIRLYRMDVPTPAGNIESEHDLDSLTTEILLVPEKRDFDAYPDAYPGDNVGYVIAGRLRKE